MRFTAAPQAPYLWSWLEIAAIVLTLMAWPVGAILVVLSRVWTRREKIVATAIGAVTFAMGCCRRRSSGRASERSSHRSEEQRRSSSERSALCRSWAAAYLAYRLTRATAVAVGVA